MSENMSRQNRGGYREGSGRKVNSGKYKEKTVPIRAPVSLAPTVWDLLDELEKKANK